MLPFRLSWALTTLLIIFTLLDSSAYVQASPAPLQSPSSHNSQSHSSQSHSSLFHSPPSHSPPHRIVPTQSHSAQASTSGTKPVPEAPYLYSWSSSSSRASSPTRDKLSAHGARMPRTPGRVSPPMSDRPFKYIDLTEFRHSLVQPALPAHQRPRPKNSRANAPWEKGKGVLEGPPPAPASPSPERKKKMEATGRPAHLLEADVREDPPELPVGKNVGKTRGGLWRKMAWCLGSCAKKT